MTKMKNTAVALPEEIIREIDKLAGRGETQSTRGKIIREALAKYINERGG